MKFEKHLELKGKHAFLSPSNYHWINYSKDKLTKTYHGQRQIELGTLDHEFASICIQRKKHLPNDGSTLSLFVNDCLDNNMESEQPLYYSENCFGTADAISFEKKKLKIFDLKTGVTPASVHQLEIYAALFCLNYHHSPEKISIELRIYQNNEVSVFEPSCMDISDIMDKIVEFDKMIEKLKMEE